jgi:hypothetical protein
MTKPIHENETKEAKLQALYEQFKAKDTEYQYTRNFYISGVEKALKKWGNLSSVYYPNEKYTIFHNDIIFSIYKGDSKLYSSTRIPAKSKTINISELSDIVLAKIYNVISEVELLISSEIERNIDKTNNKLKTFKKVK